MTKVLIADDHHVIREALKKVLTDFDIVGEARDGESALEMVKQTNPDLILLDLIMPKRSGLSVIPEIRQQNADIKILVFTIHDSTCDARKAFESGANGYFLKDQSSSALRSAISDVLNGKRYVSPGMPDLDLK